MKNAHRSMSPCGRMKELHRFIKRCHSGGADKLYNIINVKNFTV